MSDKAGDSLSYIEYVPEGKRTAQIDTAIGTRTEYVVDDNSNTLTATETQNGTTQVTTYTYGNGLISQYNETNGYLTFHYNNIGSTMMLTDANGNVNEEYSYGPYGELLSGDASKLIGQNMLNMLQNECNREG